MLANKLEQLDEQLQDNSVELTKEEVVEQFKIDGLDSADWALRKIAINNKALQEKEELFAKYEQWIKAERAKTERDNSFFEYLLTDYHARILAENPKQKSISTPNGKVQSTTRKPAIVKPEKDSLPQLIEYAEQNEFADFVEVKKELKWTEFKKELTLTDDLKVVDSNGQVVPNIPISEGGTTFKITT
ncbi:host-nuclease inhibitor Gam family protein [Lysinibacillus sp. G4S2]|uniref:host-nuclease inhibitor Gam family protein n=1 Tax=Lysinibacillus sp. G4S2 TaxID=3055859 RepID=UPI0025A041A6|nr:host-nuclease inhibitor Gam family protein [Lysinibacillus sp. G4S2]MDM5245728.1 host-nuclease inhibitor Gam family protein [Lysinibacillus sp. G4S2]